MKAVILAAALAALANPAQALCPGDDHSKTFDKVVKRTFKAIKTQDGAALVDIFSRDGVRFGDAVVPYADLQQQFTNRTDAYCDFFVCEAQPGFLNRLGGGISVSKSVTNTFLAVSGSVSVTNTSFASGLRLDYGLDAQCQWRLTAVVYDRPAM